MGQKQTAIILFLLFGNLLVLCGGFAFLFFALRPQKAPAVTAPTPIALNSPTALPSLPTPTNTPTATPKLTLPIPTSTLKAALPTALALSDSFNAIIKPIDLVANDLLFDSMRRVIYASVPGRGGASGNSITTISVPTGTIASSISVGSEPNRLALSDDGQYVYVGLDGAASVRRVNLLTNAAEIEFALGSDFCGPLHVEDMAVIPGNSHAIAISKSNGKCSPRHAGIAIYDDGIPRSKTTPGHTGSNVIRFISPFILYGYNNESTEFGLRTMQVSPEGIVISATVQNLLSGFEHRIFLDDGLIYSTSGQVIDPKKMVLLGTFPVKGYIAPDSKAGRVYFLTLASIRGPYQIKVFDMRTFVLLASVDLENVEGLPRGFIQVEPNQFVFQTSADKVYLVRLVPAGIKTN